MKVKSVTLTLLIGLVLMWSSEAFAAKDKFVFVDIKKKANAICVWQTSSIKRLLHKG